MKKIIIFMIVLALSLVVGGLSANRSNDLKHSNDTIVYKEHFDCLSSGRESNECNIILSTNQLEVTYHALVQFASQIMNFEIYKFLFAFTVAFLICHSVCSLTSGSFFGLLYLILDFRFWEYTTNTLRVGMALALVMMAFLLYFKPGKRYVSNVIYLGPLSHLTTVIFLAIPKKKINFLYLMMLFLISIVTFKFESLWVSTLIDNIAVDSKLYFYTLSGKPEYQVPLHYNVVVLGSLLFYKRATSSIFVVTANTLYVLIMASFIFGVIGMSYRIASFMLPFVIISMVLQVNYISNKFKYGRSFMLILCHIILLGVFLYAFKNNSSLLFEHLS